MHSNLAALAWLMGHLSLLAIGGVNATLAEMQRQVVDVHGWMSAHEFASLFALAQAAPGPNMMVSTLVGWRVAGMTGALVATLAIITPSCLLTFLVARLWHQHRQATWRNIAQAGLTAVTVGLVMAAAWGLAMATSVSVMAGLITLVCTLVFVTTRLNPLWLLGAAALIGAFGLV